MLDEHLGGRPTPISFSICKIPMHGVTKGHLMSSGASSFLFLGCLLMDSLLEVSDE